MSSATCGRWNSLPGSTVGLCLGLKLNSSFKVRASLYPCFPKSLLCSIDVRKTDVNCSFTQFPSSQSLEYHRHHRNDNKNVPFLDVYKVRLCLSSEHYKIDIQDGLERSPNAMPYFLLYRGYERSSKFLNKSNSSFTLRLRYYIKNLSQYSPAYWTLFLITKHSHDEYCQLTVSGTVHGKKKNLCINEIYVAHVRIQKRVLIIIYTCQCVDDFEVSRIRKKKLIIKTQIDIFKIRKKNLQEKYNNNNNNNHTITCGGGGRCPVGRL
ncbi:hypothetical protein AGLY_013242 [Aphis glycines]|uniref:Uncharacterized protein n=1 Tax=Aphis glycines TaxID=307491 RepID=A0A6G0T5R9_APHGL|nr:hypothetical protein AGLY_013242 [Aphis glycines]